MICLNSHFEYSENISNKILTMLPQQPPFRFLDRIVEINHDRIIGEYTYRPDESFYSGHFAGPPITPGAIMIETMAQTAVVALGIFLMINESNVDPANITSDYLTVFSSAEAEFFKQIAPGTKVICKGEKLYWRMRNLKSKANLYDEEGDLIATATLSGVGIKKNVPLQ